MERSKQQVSFFRQQFGSARDPSSFRYLDRVYQIAIMPIATLSDYIIHTLKIDLVKTDSSQVIVNNGHFDVFWQDYFKQNVV